MRDTDPCFLPLEVKLSGVGKFTAYASTFDGEPDSYGDTVAPGAFAGTIEQHRKAGTRPALLWSHQQNTPIGVIDVMREDANGLHIAGTLALDVDKGREAYALMKLGGLSMSIGYRAVRFSKNGSFGRRLDVVALHEISAVALPANPKAKVLSIKGNGTNCTLKSLMRSNAKLAQISLSQKITTAIRRIENSV